MSLSDKAHDLVNWIVGITGLTAPIWMQLLEQATTVIKFFTALGGLAIVIVQLKRTYNRRP